MKLKIMLAFCTLMLATGSALAAQSPRKVTFDDLDGVSSRDGVVYASLDIAPDGRQLAVERGRTLRVIDAATGRVLHELGKGLLPRWSPRGDKLAFYSLRSGKLQLWMWNAANGKLRQLTDFPVGVDPDPYTRIFGYVSDAFRFDWSPDGMRIAFASRVAIPSRYRAEETGQPLVLDEHTPPDLTLQGVFAHPGMGTGGIPESDGRNLVYRTSDPNETLLNRIFVIDVKTHALNLISKNMGTSFHPSWSPDGSRIAFASVGSDDGNEINLLSAKDGRIVVYDVRTRHLQVLVKGQGFKYRPRWSKEGNEIAYLLGSNIFAEPSLEVIDANSARPEKNYNIGLHIMDYDWSWSGDGFLLSYLDKETISLKRLNTDGKLASITAGASTSVGLGPWAQARDGTVAWVEGAAGPGIRIAQAGRTELGRITLRLPQTALKLGKINVITYRTARGDVLQGKLLYPPDYQSGKRYPLIVDAYPLTSGSGWMHPMYGNQAWAAAGYMVFKPNQARAPHVWANCSGKPDFCNASRGPGAWDVMVDDVMSGVDALISRGLVDPQRMCLYGHSNGGGVVDYLVTRTDRFKCAIAVAPVLPNWIGPPLLDLGTWQLISKWAGADPLHNAGAYVKLSAVFHVDNVKTPMLIADGEEDGQFLLGSIEMYNALRFAGKQVTFLRYPNEGHVFVGPGLRDLWNREMAFFARYLHPEK
jgi:dipeptidyl aminopeptidase/acylaminoacyl peptidase